jgi:hypothetical protein
MTELTEPERSGSVGAYTLIVNFFSDFGI